MAYPSLQAIRRIASKTGFNTGATYQRYSVSGIVSSLNAKVALSGHFQHGVTASNIRNFSNNDDSIPCITKKQQKGYIAAHNTTAKGITPSFYVHYNERCVFSESSPHHLAQIRYHVGYAITNSVNNSKSSKKGNVEVNVATDDPRARVKLDTLKEVIRNSTYENADGQVQVDKTKIGLVIDAYSKAIKYVARTRGRDSASKAESLLNEMIESFIGARFQDEKGVTNKVTNPNIYLQFNNDGSLAEGY
jgi:hypothetical protein